LPERLTFGTRGTTIDPTVLELARASNVRDGTGHLGVVIELARAPNVRDERQLKVLELARAVDVRDGIPMT